MALPRLDHTVFTVSLTGLGKKVKYRRFTNAEQKALLDAKSEKDKDMIYENVKNVVSQCILDKINVDDLTVYDFEELFVRIRSKSVDQYATGTIRSPYVDEEGNEKVHRYDFTINCDDITIKQPDVEVSTDIQVSEKYTLRLKKPTIGSISKDASETDFIINHMECLFSNDGEEVYYLADESKEEIMKLYDELETPVMMEIERFFANQPTLYYKLEYKLPNGEDAEYIFRTLEDFFT